MIKTYAYHKPGPAATEKIKLLREAFSHLHQVIADNSPPSREQSLAFTYLETAAMWGIKSVVLRDPESTTPEM